MTENGFSIEGRRAFGQIRRAGVCCINRQLSSSIGTDSPIFWIFRLPRFDVSPANAPFSRACAPHDPFDTIFGWETIDFQTFQSLVVWGVSGGTNRGADGGRRFCSFQDFRILAFRQISRAGVYSINRPLLKKFGRRLPEIFRCRFSTLAFRQIRRAGVSCINRLLLKKFGQHLADNLTIPSRRPARDLVSNLRIHTQRM